ncbi:hypothetical protein F2Q70_00001575 [Brassica cretica]|uniref:Uncharacterized protein n=1 Tax=Brassica cretica TaxID=69181 RepID=A0A8S9IVJ4_BRACR|nr:hypothetical protein F2Q70_00001575 [Brassica cretica]
MAMVHYLQIRRRCARLHLNDLKPPSSSMAHFTSTSLAALLTLNTNQKVLSTMKERKRMRKEKEKQNLNLGMSRDGEEDRKMSSFYSE